MARTFDANTANNLSVDVAAVTAAPLTMACWFIADDVTTLRNLMWVGDKDVTNAYFALSVRGDVANDPIEARTRSSATSAAAQTSTGYSAATWHHACGVWAGAADRKVYLDGAGEGTNTTSVTPAGIDRTTIGLYGASTPANPFDGRIAEAAIWNVALTANERLMLAAGVSPLRVRAASLIAYYPIGRGSPEPNLAKGTITLNLTVNGTLAIGDHAPVAPMFALLEGWLGAFTTPAAPGGFTPRLSLLGVG